MVLDTARALGFHPHAMSTVICVSRNLVLLDQIWEVGSDFGA